VDEKPRKPGSFKRILKKSIRASVVGGAILGSIFGATSCLAKWTYQVKKNYGVVVTEWDGNRIAVSEQGWHFRTPLFSSYEAEYPMSNQMVFLHGKTKPHEVITKSGPSGEATVIMASAATFYEIEDLNQYAIENFRGNLAAQEYYDEFSESPRVIKVDPRGMVQRTLDSIIGEKIQMSSAKDMIHNRHVVEDEILHSILDSDVQSMYGIKINGFRFTETNYIDEVVTANARKQASVAEAEGKFAAAQIEKKTIETLAKAQAENYEILEKALNPKTSEEKMAAQEVFKDLVKYRTIKERSGDTVWMLSGDSKPNPAYWP